MHGKAAAVPASEAVIVARPTSASVDWPASLQSLLATVVIATFVITFVVQAFQIPSESMENTLLIGDYLLVDKFCYGEAGIWGALMPYRKIQRGDVVVFHYPVRPSQHFVKRVVGIPGDRVRMLNRQVWVNGNPLKEPYVRYSSPVRDLFRDDFPRLDIPAPGLEAGWRSEEHTSELQSQSNLVCRLLLEKKKTSDHHHPRQLGMALIIITTISRAT